MKGKYKRTTKRTKRTKRAKARRKKYNSCLRRSNKKPVLIFIILLIAVGALLYNKLPDCIEIKFMVTDAQRDAIKEVVKEVLQEEQIKEEQSIIVKESTSAESANNEQPTQEITSRGGTVRPASAKLTNYRITSYYPGDGCASGTKTGSGKSISDFGTTKIGNKTVYTYKGKVVVAAATKELLNSGYNVRGSQNSQDKHYFKYYDEISLEIDGQSYDAIVLDSCGAAMWEGEYRIDIFVPSASNVINAYDVTVQL